MTTANEAPSPRLGIVLLDGPRYEGDFGCFEPTDEVGLAPSQRGFFGHPSSWPMSTAYAVARGANAESTLAATDQATKGLAEAIERLEPVADLITSDCGFFWGVRRRGELRSAAPLLLSGIDLIELAADVTADPIGILSYSTREGEQMLAEHPQRERLRVVGFSDEPAWLTLAPEHCDQPGWSAAQLDRDGLGVDVAGVVAGELDGGELEGIGALVIECTVLPQFRGLLRGLTRVPIFDVATACLALLGGSTAGIHQFDPDRRTRVASG